MQQVLKKFENVERRSVTKFQKDFDIKPFVFIKIPKQIESRQPKQSTNRAATVQPVIFPKLVSTMINRV
jgi:hypothetical protein